MTLTLLALAARAEPTRLAVVLSSDEGRPGEEAILTCRLIDRPLRPSFVKGLRNEVQVVVTILSLDPNNPYDVLAINGPSYRLEYRLNLVTEGEPMP